MVRLSTRYRSTCSALITGPTFALSTRLHEALTSSAGSFSLSLSPPLVYFKSSFFFGPHDRKLELAQLCGSFVAKLGPKIGPEKKKQQKKAWG